MAASTTNELSPLEQLQADVQRYRTNTLLSLRRDARTQRDRVRQEAMSALERAARDAAIPEDSQSALAHAILASVRDVVTPVIASLNIQPHLAMTVREGWAQHWLKVETNYWSVNVQLAKYAVPAGTPEPEELARIMTIVKALVYHEVGHILYSVPLADLLGQARFQGANVPIVQQPATSEVDTSALYGWAYAMFDDQRMECALVHMSPVFGDYLTTSTVAMIVDKAAETDAVGDIWPMVCGRSFLPADLLRRLRREAVRFARAHGLEAELAILEREVAEFKRATREREMFEAIDRALPALRAWFHGRRTYTALQHSSHAPSRPQHLRLTGEMKDLGALPSPEASATETPTLTSSDGTGEVQAPARPLRGGKRSASKDRDGRPEDDEDPSTEQQPPTISYLDHDLVKKLTPMGEVEGTMKAYHGMRVRHLYREFQVRPMNGEQTARSQTVRASMLDLLVPLTSQAAPAWRSRQDEGVLDPIVYLMREPGDTDYWSSLDDRGNPGPNLAVSLVLDVSASMQNEVVDLFIAAIGVRLACDELGLPCTVTTFSDDSRILFDADDQTQEVVGMSQGGTNPIGAFCDLVNQRHGKKDQLVIVFTDGVWFEVEHVEPYRSPGSVMVGVTLDRSTADYLERKDFDEVVVIDSVAEFADAVMTALVPYYG